MLTVFGYVLAVLLFVGGIFVIAMLIGRAAPS